MSTIHLRQTTTLTPEQYVAGLTDFGPGRSKLFGNSADEYLKVHHRGRSEADVTEGSGGIWERLHYDWSDPKRVVLTTTDSNVPTPVSPGEDKLVCAHHIQNLRSSAPCKRVRAQHGEALIADHLVETIFIIAKVPPVLFREPGRIPGHSDAGIASGRYLSEFLIPSGCESLAIKRATPEKKVAGRRNF